MERSMERLSSVFRIRWNILIVTFLIHLVLPNLILSYGIIFIAKTEHGAMASEAFLSPSIFCIAQLFFEPWFRELGETCPKYFSTRSLSSIGILLTSAGLCICTFIESQILFAFIYGLMGGIGTTLTLSQIDYVISETYYSDVDLIQIFTNMGRSIGQFGMTYLIYIIFSIYGHNMGFILLSAVVIQLMPLTFCINIKTSINPPTVCEYTKSYKSVDDLSTTEGVIQLSELSKSWKSPSDENLNQYEDITYFERSQFGFEILPQIPEENEDVESLAEGRDKLDRAINRMSVISDRLGVYITTEDKNEINSPLKRNKSMSTKELHRRYRQTLNRKPSCCSSYSFYRFKKHVTNFWDSLNEALFSPFILSLKTWQFYPAILLKISAIFVPMATATLLPFYFKTINPRTLVIDAILLIALYGVGWIFFLLTTPCIVNLSKSKYQYILIVGLIASSAQLFVLIETNHYMLLMILSGVLGFSNGAILFTYKDVVRETIGARRWSKIKDTLDRVSAIFMILFTIWTVFLIDYELKFSFGLLSGIHALTGIIFALIPVFRALKKRRNSAEFWPGM